MRVHLAVVLFALSTLLAPVTPAAAQEGQPTTVILVRHAEKAAVPGADPPLSPEGELRARDLAAALRDAGVRAIVTTQFQRTQATAAPLAAQLGLTPEVVPASGDVAAHARQVAEHVLGRHAGGTVVVVGHSNTIPAIVRVLGGTASEIPDPVYDHVFVVLRGADGRARTLQVRYGLATPATP